MPTVLESTTMRIGELAERTGVSRRSLRHYEREGLITAERAANGYRVYDELTAVHVANIRDLVRSGLTLDDIRPSMRMGCLDQPLDDQPACTSALRVGLHRLERLDRQIASLTEDRARLVAHIERNRRALADQAGASPAHR